MKTHLLTLCILLGSFFSRLAYGDDIPTHGMWDDERYRSVTPQPPTLSIEGNILSIKLVDTLDNLTICIIDNTGNILYKNVFSGNMGEVFDISLNEIVIGTHQIILMHKYGWIMGEFENQ